METGSGFPENLDYILLEALNMQIIWCFLPNIAILVLSKSFLNTLKAKATLYNLKAKQFFKVLASKDWMTVRIRISIHRIYLFLSVFAMNNDVLNDIITTYSYLSMYLSVFLQIAKL